jgi:palmitoyltransferase
LFSAAQKGDLALIQSFLEKKGIGIVHERDNENCTLLHWAAINNHLELCRWLVQNGAQVDAIGGTLQATPAQWASRYCILHQVEFF